MNKCFLISSFGIRDGYKKLIKNIRQYSDLPIYVVTDTEIDYSNQILVNNTFNGKHKNYHASDYWRIAAKKYIPEDIIFYLDDDMFICNSNALQGFDLCYKFGFCVPLNPRSLIKYDNKGRDANKKEEDLIYATSYNTSPIIYNKNHLLTDCYVNFFIDNPMRGPMALWYAIKYSNCHPYTLPYQWCVSNENIGIQEPLILHLGHKNVKDYYADIKCICPS